MMSVEQLRAGFQKQLEGWQAAVQAFEVQAHLGQKEAMDRLEGQKQQFAEALERLKAELQHSRNLAEQQRQLLAAALDHLRLQLALGRAESREVFEQQERAVREAVGRLDTELDRAVDAVSQAALEQYVRWTALMRAEFDAASAQFSQVRDHQQALWAASLQAFEVNLEAFKNQLVDAQQQATLQTQQMQKNLSDGMEQLREAFARLFHTGGKP